MSLVTRCPVCATTFRVTPVQLSARSGRVRCGKCSAVFDGVSNLLTEEAVAALPAEPSPQLGLFAVREPSGIQDEGPAHASLGAEAATAVAENGTTPDVRVDGTDTDREAPPPKPAPETVVVPAFLAPEAPAAGHFVVWTLLALIALCALALQAGMHFRTEIGVLLPQARPHLETACEFLGCEVRLPRRVDLLSIESSDLQADGQRPGVIVLNALLRNRAPFAQEFPDLELTLTDQSERAVIRKVLKPLDYLQDKRSLLPAGMSGGSEEAVRIFLDTGGILATGYQLFLFYPCPPASGSAYWALSYPSRCLESGNK
jgi:predicted Zn finger-like uncharacterized protein